MIYLRNNKVNTCYLGDKKLNKIYLGDKLVWPYDANGHDYVDLGLPSGTLWATCNVGASKPSDSGLFFQWGDVQGYTAEQVGTGEGKKAFKWTDYKWRLSGNNDSNVAFTEYTTPNAKLELEDDAAHVNMGGDWHMPTTEQFKELVDETDNTWTTQGRLFKSKTDPSKSIFIPAAGYAWDGSIHDSGSFGYVWSSMLVAGNVNNGQYLCFSSSNVYLHDGGRYNGLSVRGVLAEN